MHSVCLISPVRESVPAPAAHGLVNFAVDYTRRGGRLQYFVNWRSSCLATARNELVALALGTDAEVIVFADADIVFRNDHIYDLLAADEDVVSGMFKRRNAEIANADAWVGAPLDSDAEPDSRSLIEMSHIGFGLVAMKRHVLERLVAKYGGGLFEFRWNGSQVQGEDYTFCDRWREMGGRIWAHNDVRLAHVGPHIFT